MNSPPDPGSPTDSASSSGTPPPEELVSVNHPHNPPAEAGGRSSSSTLGLFQLANQVAASLSGSSKRRNPSGGSAGASSSARDSKLRRRGEPVRSAWDVRGDSAQGSGRKEKEDLVDSSIVDYLRKEIGDPFLEISTS